MSTTGGDKKERLEKLIGYLCIRSSSGECVFTEDICCCCIVQDQTNDLTANHPVTFIAGEFDLCDVTAVKCKICTAANEEAICNDDYTTQVLQRSVTAAISSSLIFF